MDTIREDPHAFCPYDNDYILDDVHLGHLHGEFEVPDKGPGLKVEIVGEFSDDVVISVPEEYHECLLLPLPRDFQLNVHILFVSALNMFACDCREV